MKTSTGHTVRTKHTQAWVYEEAGLTSKTGSGARLKHFGLSTFKGYTIYRYKNER